MTRFYQLLLLCATVAISHAMPMGCAEDTHCPSGFFCDLGRLFCNQCLSCELFKRSPPAIGTGCVTNVGECGPCFKGLVARGEGSECMRPLSSRWSLLDLPPYAWAVIALGMLVLGLLVSFAAVYVLRNFHTFKILCSTRTSVHTPQEQLPIDASAPPPYHAVVENLLPTTPSVDLGEACPFIMPVAVTPRQSASRQGARVFCPPDYSSSAGIHEAAELPLQDPRTSPEPHHSSINTMVSEVATAREVERSLANPQDGNTYSGERTHDRQFDGPGPTFFANTTSPVIINVIKNVNSNRSANSDDTAVYD